LKPFQPKNRSLESSQMAPGIMIIGRELDANACADAWEVICIRRCPDNTIVKVYEDIQSRVMYRSWRRVFLDAWLEQQQPNKLPGRTLHGSATTATGQPHPIVWT